MSPSKNTQCIAQQLASFVNDLSIDICPLSVVDEAKRCILDTIGVIIAGQSSSLALKTKMHASSAYGSGGAHILGTNESLHPMAAALVNGTAGHANDFDDTSYTGIMHGSVVVLPAALALAEEHGVSGARLLEAFIAGVEVEYAIAELCTDRIYFKGWWTSGVYGAFGAAAACAKILGLNHTETVNAIGLAAAQCAGMKASFGTDSKPLGIGMAASKGMECALLAAAGLSGPVDVFENKNGFLKLLNDNQHDPSFDLQLFERWRLVTPGVLFKSYPVCSAAQAGAELTKLLMEKHDLVANDIERVICEVPPLVDISLVYHRPKTIREAQFSMPFAVACMLAYGRLELGHLKDEVLLDFELQAQIEKVSMHVPDYLAQDPDVLQRCPEGAGVRLLSNNHMTYEGFLAKPTGMPDNPISTEALLEKFLGCTGHVQFDETVARNLAGRLLELDRCEDIGSLFA